MKFWKMGVRSTLLVISAPLVVSVLIIACTGGAASPELATPESQPAESSVPALPPAQSPAPETTAPLPAAAGAADGSAAAEVAPDELSAYALSQLAILSQTLGPRQSATAEEKEAADYLASQFAEHGFSVQVQPFTVRSFSQDDSGLFLTQGDLTRVEVEPITGTGSGDVAGQLVSAGEDDRSL